MIKTDSSVPRAAATCRKTTPLQDEADRLLEEAKKLSLEVHFAPALTLMNKIVAFRFRARAHRFEVPTELETYLRTGEIIAANSQK